MRRVHMAQILVLGGTGFIGHHLLHRLVARGDKVIVPTRRLRRARDMYLLPTAEFVLADIHDDVTLTRLVNTCDAVVNLVGILHGRPADFARAHVELPRRLAAACARAGVEHIVHMSALGASPDAPSEYLRSKAAGEAALKAGGVDATIFRPSVVFGHDDRFLNLFAALQRLSPVLFLACPGARFQPVHVEDVSACFARALLDLPSYGRTYELCGPKVYTLRQLVEYVGHASGHPRPIVGLSDSLSELQALFMEWLPVKLMSRDNVRSMKVDSTCDAPFPFGIVPAALEAVAPAWLHAGPGLRTHAWRARAGR
jgi:uncharacterized protein YbjT (DUF2867 family)